MIKPEEKAKSLVEMFRIFTTHEQYDTETHNAKQCAFICVSEILINIIGSNLSGDTSKDEEYWQQVEKEIEKL